jgi:hypothetical protein
MSWARNPWPPTLSEVEGTNVTAADAVLDAWVVICPEPD